MLPASCFSAVMYAIVLFLVSLSAVSACSLSKIQNHNSTAVNCKKGCDAFSGVCKKQHLKTAVAFWSNALIYIIKVLQM